jgi:hypothetical protein
MWVCIRPRGGQECYLLTCEITERVKFCPIHRFDGMDQVPVHGNETFSSRPENRVDHEVAASGSAANCRQDFSSRRFPRSKRRQ